MARAGSLMAKDFRYFISHYEQVEGISQAQGFKWKNFDDQVSKVGDPCGIYRTILDHLTLFRG